MGEREAFIRQICENPADNTVRLVYADWLTENAGAVVCPACADAEPTEDCEPHPSDIKCPTCRGAGRIPDDYHDRAEYIRWNLGVSLPSRKPFDTSPSLEWHPPIPRHTRREGPDRIEYLNGDGLAISLVYSRGFVSHLECTCKQFMADRFAAELFASQPITSVRLTDYIFCGRSREGEWILRVNNLGLRVPPESTATYLPVAFKPLIKGGEVYIEAYGDRRYDSEAEALTALSQACVAYGRDCAAHFLP